MKKLLRNFLEEKITKDFCNDKFDYKFDMDCSTDKFKSEFKKFLGLYTAFFYNDNRFVTIINSCEIIISKKNVEHLFKLYLYSNEKNLTYEKIVLLEFLYTYFNSINTSEYKQNYKDYDKSKKDFKSVLEEFGISRKFFSEAIDIIFDFYNKLLNYGIKNKMFIDQEIINRIFNNLRCNKDYYNKLLDILVSNKVNLHSVIKFDKNINKHLDVYLKYIEKSISEFGGYSYVDEMLLELDKSKVLDTKCNNIIINKYVEVTNKLCRKLESKEYSFIQGLSEINDLKKQLVTYLQNIESLSEHQKEKMRECLSYLLRLKRYLISDENYVNSEMHESSFQEEISTKEVEKFRKSLLDNKFALYSASKIRFTSDVGNALESYAKYPLQSIVTIYHIDSSSQIYSIGIDDKKKKNNNFKKYYDEVGKEYTIKHKGLMNKLSMDYYEELLKYLSKTFFMHQNLTLSVLGNEDFRKIIDELKKEILYNFDNDYAIVVNNILVIETDIIKLLEKNNLPISSDGFDNLNTLFTLYDDIEKKDGLMYLNYILYEKSGLNLRNSMVHGAMINNNLDVALLVTFSGLIFVSWLLNDK